MTDQTTTIPPAQGAQPIQQEPPRDYPEVPEVEQAQPVPVPPPQGTPPVPPQATEQPQDDSKPAQDEPKPSLLARKVGTKDIGWLNRIFVKARNEVRRKGRNGELDELGYEKDEKTENYLGIGFQEMIDISWTTVEPDLNAWTADLTGYTPEECAEDISILFGVIDEMEDGGKLSPLFRVLMRLQGRTSSGGGQGTS